MPYLFAGTLFLSAALLFIVEPMIAKMILPLLGGSPAVWNTCLVFFQAALLGGYLYAHALGTWLSFRLQVVVHLGLLCTALLLLPVGLPAWLIEQIPHDANPVPWLLSLLAVAIGLPFFVVAASAPLLQKWYAAGGAADAGDPYFLYAASNLGSMIALASYPFLVEPNATLGEQSWLWAGGYAVLLLLTFSCALAVKLSTRSVTRGDPPGQAAPQEVTAALAVGAVPSASVQVGVALLQPESGSRRPEPESADLSPRFERPLTVGRRFRWVVLAFAPSSLLLGVTTYITMDIAAIPLLWVIPLALYLLSFIVVFARKQLIPHAWMVRALPSLALAAVFTLVASTALASWWFIPLHWLMLFVAALVCHGELADDRPPPRFLTEFYLWIAVGGVLVGLLNALLATSLFQGRVLEYPLALLLACCLAPAQRPGGSTSVPTRWLDLLLPAALGAITLTLMVLLGAFDAPEQWRHNRVFVYGAVAVGCYLCVRRPVRFALALGVAMFTLMLAAPGSIRTLYTERNFFGLVRVQAGGLSAQPTGPGKKPAFHLLNHGSTLHGIQRLGADGKPVQNPEPLSYFHRAGPVGQVFDAWRSRPDLPPQVAVTGLGVGALASYAWSHENWTFYELDPAIQRIALNENFFTYLAHSPAGELKIVLGDARLRLQEAADHSFGLILLDAFSSDSVPTHLIDQEALRLYNAKRAKGGLLVFNITNRYLDLEPVLARLAEDAGMVAFARQEYFGIDVDTSDIEAGRLPSHWVVLADQDQDLVALPRDGRWHRLSSPPGTRVWTDDYVNLLRVIRWQRE
jgi:hypothetical protein